LIHHLAQLKQTSALSFDGRYRSDPWLWRCFDVGVRILVAQSRWTEVEVKSENECENENDLAHESYRHLANNEIICVH
jgi:hypothetical protein